MCEPFGLRKEAVKSFKSIIRYLQTRLCIWGRNRGMLIVQNPSIVMLNSERWK